jgi:hypothetical protein
MNPTAFLALMILAFLLPAAASVVLAWWVWRGGLKPVAIDGWRNRITYCGLIASTAGFFLESTFLLREYAFSYRPADPFPLWDAVAWTAILSWILILLAATLGKGGVRWLLVAFVIASFLGCAFFVGIMD